ncbi:ABC transporter ATP-binding protein [Oceanobacillus sp. FSL K6-2867]|uniref:ABC transporter ATP-binding protein n=1 Tax=Oceanobacillus sp. FSL K6-2867 TaxID=2954748 RepID=UPI0030DAB0A6
MMRLSVRNLKVKYSNRIIIDRVSADFVGGEMVSIIGKNGVGKTTFIRAIAKLIRCSGQVRLYDEERTYSERDMVYVPQMGTSSSQLTVFEMVLLGLVKDLRWKVREKHINKVNEILSQLKLSHLSMKKFYELSGGQKQLIYMAQSFVSRPKVLLLDEPTSALDLRHQLVVMDHVRKYTQRAGAITIFVVHDLMLAARYSDRMLLIDDAKIMIQGEPGEVLLTDLLESAYDVQVNVEKNTLGQFSIIPQSPIYSSTHT